MREVAILQQCQGHPNIIHLHEVIQDQVSYEYRETTPTTMIVSLDNEKTEVILILIVPDYIIIHLFSIDFFCLFYFYCCPVL